MWCRRLVRAVILGACLFGHARPGGASIARGQGEPATSAALTPAEAMRAFGIVEAWVRAGTVGAEGVGQAGGSRDGALPPTHGAAVTLRVDGEVVGRGTALAEDVTAGSSIRAAAERAIGEARGAMPRASDALLEAAGASGYWARATLSIEFAGPLVPLGIVTYDDADADVRPGVEGVAARVGSRVEVVFPGTMLTRNIGPGDALASAITRAAGEPGVALREDPAGQPGKLAESRGVRCYRFRTLHIAHTAAGGSAIFLDRGGRLVRGWPRSGADLREWSAGMAQHLVARRRIEGEVPEYAGAYRPVTGTFDPPGESGFEEILTMRALIAFAESPGVDAGGAAAAVRAAVEIGDVVAGRGTGARSAAKHFGAAALWSCVLPRLAERRDPPCSASDDSSWPRSWRESYRAALVKLERGAAGPDDVPPGERAVIAFALARRSGESWAGVGEGTGPRADAALAAVFEGTPRGQLAAHMPWLGWGELCTRGDGVGAAAALREFRETVFTHQLRPEAMDADNADLAGGIVFTGARSPLPTWQTARVAAFLASALADARITDGAERMKETARLMDTLRFLRQLTADEACGFMYADPGRAMGGVRAALWDQRQPAEATALTLITACEVMRAARTVPPAAGSP